MILVPLIFFFFFWLIDYRLNRSVKNRIFSIFGIFDHVWSIKQWSKNWFFLLLNFVFGIAAPYKRISICPYKHRYAHIDILVLFGFDFKSLVSYFCDKIILQMVISTQCKWFIIISLCIRHHRLKIMSKNLIKSSNQRYPIKKQEGKFRALIFLHQLRIQCFINRPLTLTPPVFAVAVKLILYLPIFCIFNFRKNRRFYFHLFSYKCF